MEIEKKLKNIIATLECVSVNGAENWNRMLACSQALRELLNEVKKNGEE